MKKIICFLIIILTFVFIYNVIIKDLNFNQSLNDSSNNEILVSTERVEGATELGSITIDGDVYNVPQGSSGVESETQLKKEILYTVDLASVINVRYSDYWLFFDIPFDMNLVNILKDEYIDLKVVINGNGIEEGIEFGVDISLDSTIKQGIQLGPTCVLARSFGGIMTTGFSGDDYIIDTPCNLKIKAQYQLNSNNGEIFVEYYSSSDILVILSLLQVNSLTVTLEGTKLIF